MGLFKDCGCGCKGQKQQQKFMASILGALIFYVLASPEAFRLVRSIVGKWVATPNGSPSPGGLLLHTLVFLLIVWGTMNIKAEYMEAEEEPAEEEMEEEMEEEEPIEEEAVEEEPVSAEDGEEGAEGTEEMSGEADAEIVEEVEEVDPEPASLLDEDADASEMEAMPVDGSSLTMSSPEGEIVDSCTLKSGKKLVIRQ
jgi:hypothetical protein